MPLTITRRNYSSSGFGKQPVPERIGRGVKEPLLTL